jgi:NAD(P)-dependent dehydrogenase (short-subunit alcohol dehydrogenase family)
VLITEDMVRSMRRGSVVVDLAAEQGGNCALTQPGKIANIEGVSIVGFTDLPGRMASQASQLLGNNMVNLLDAKLASLNPDYFTYTLSKIGFEGLTELTARSYAPRLRCVGIAPAVTLVSGPQTRENFEAVHGLNPLGRGVTVDDILTALRFIIATPTFNAQTIVLDGGQRLLGLPRDVAHMVEK